MARKRTVAKQVAKTVARTVAKRATKKAAKKVVKKVAGALVKAAARKAVGGLAATAAVAVAGAVATKVASTSAKRAAARKRVAAAPPDLPPAFARVVRAYERDPDVTAGVMMNAYGLKVRGKIFAMLPGGRFVVKLPRSRVDDLVARGLGRHFDPGHGRPMTEWIEIEGSEERWLGWAREAYAYVGAGSEE